ncbi:hypothetical protein [Iodidimonas gelatinilytica]|nr:hypothetical protein [Iodidimonas gelatinilytica]
MVSHRPSHIRLADRVLQLENGMLVHDGTPEQIYARIGEKTL